MNGCLPRIGFRTAFSSFLLVFVAQPVLADVAGPKTQPQTRPLARPSFRAFFAPLRKPEPIQAGTPTPSGFQPNLNRYGVSTYQPWSAYYTYRGAYGYRSSPVEPWSWESIPGAYPTGVGYVEPNNSPFLSGEFNSDRPLRTPQIVRTTDPSSTRESAVARENDRDVRPVAGPLP